MYEDYSVVRFTTYMKTTVLSDLPHVRRLQCCQIYNMYEDYSVVRFTTCMKTTVYPDLPHI